MTMHDMRRRARNLVFLARFRVQRIASKVSYRAAELEVPLRAALLFVTALALGWVIASGTDLGKASAELTTAILIAMGSLFGGVLAIVFGLSSFMQQSASHLYSSQFYNAYVHDWSQRFIFTALALLTISSFGLALYQQAALVPVSQAIIIHLMLLMTAAVLTLVDWEYRRVTKKVNPVEAIKFLERQCLKSLGRVHNLATTVAAWLRVGQERLTQDQALAVSYSSFMAPRLASVDDQLGHLTEISLRLASAGDLRATKIGLAAVQNVVASYLEYRKDSSLAQPAGPYMMAVESDSQRFLARHFERMNSAAESFMARGHSAEAVFIMGLYEVLVSGVKEVEFINRPGENPILDQLRGYASGLLDSASRRDDLEVCFRSIAVFRSIGNSAVDRKLQSATLYAIYGDIAKIATWAILSRRPVFVEHCTGAMVSLIGRSVEENAPGLDVNTAEGFSQIELITLTFFTAVRAGYLPSTHSSEFMVGQCYGQLESVVAGLCASYSRMPEGRSKERLAGNLIRLFDKVHDHVRKISESIKNCDAPVVLHIGSLVEETLRNLVNLSGDAKDIRRRDGFEKHLRCYIHLPGWFMAHASQMNDTNAFDTIADIPPKVGLWLLYRQAWPQLVSESANASFSIVKEMLQKLKAGYGYAEPRAMLTVCYIGIVVRRDHGPEDQILREVIGMIKEFETLYVQKYFARFTPPEGAYMGPRPKQLLIEMLRWRADFIRERYNFVPVRDDSESIVRQMVDDADIDRFISQVWRVVPEDSSIKGELAEALKQGPEG